MRQYISGYAFLTTDPWSLTDSSYEELHMGDSISIYRKDFNTLDSTQSYMRELIVDYVINEDWVSQYDISKVEPKISRHPKTRQALNSVKVTAINSVYDSSLTENDFFMVDHMPRKEKIPGVSTLKLCLKEYLSNRANFILNEDPFQKVVCTEDSDGRGNIIERYYRTENLDSTGILFTEEDFNV